MPAQEQPDLENGRGESRVKVSTEATEDGFRVTIVFEVKRWKDFVEEIRQFVKLVAFDEEK